MEDKKKIDGRTIASLILMLLIDPVILYVFKMQGNRHYLPFSIGILLLSLIPFMMIFKKRRPQAKEFIALLVMSAIAVAARAAFIMVDQFKPMGAIIMITAVSFGPEAGFLCGGISVIASNLIFGNGPWTPWQIFAYGVGGYLIGLIFRKKRPGKLMLSVAIAIVVFAVVGFILDTCAVFTMPNMIDASKIWPVYKAGIPVNLTMAAACFIASFFLADPILDRLERMKNKYGMFEDEV
ncbi:MAG: ECF transporter S component [Firmicutes bacterium]|nr:ECF transporter S component [Bacillota bacterium]